MTLKICCTEKTRESYSDQRRAGQGQLNWQRDLGVPGARTPSEDSADLRIAWVARALKSASQRIQGRGKELRTVIEAIDQGQEELPPQIQKILDQANSEEGLPLSEVTTVVLTALDAAGVLNHLVVRRS